MSRLPRKWSTAIGVLFLLGMAATLIAPFVLGAGVMGEWRGKQMLEHTGILLTLVIAIHVVACVIVAVLGFIAIKGRPASVGVTLAVVAAPAMVGLILGRIEMSSAANHALALSEGARPGEIAHALAYTASPLLGGLLASASLLFAFAWSGLLAHWALSKRELGGRIGFFVVVSWVPALAGLAAVIASNVHRYPHPPSYGDVVSVGVVLFAFGVVFALPASRGLKTFADRTAADEALSRVLHVVWAFPVAVAMVALAHALNVLGYGLEQVSGAGGASPISAAEAEIARAHVWVAINCGLALLAVAPLLFAGGAFRRLSGPRSWERPALIVVAVLALGALWFVQGRHALLALTHERGASLDRFAAIELPQGDGNALVGSGPALRLDPQGNLAWDGGDGQLVSLDQARLDGLTSLRVAVPAGTPFSKLTPVLQQLAKGRSLTFRLVEKHLPVGADGRELSSLAKAFEPSRDGYVALTFRYCDDATPAAIAAVTKGESEPVRSLLVLSAAGDGKWTASPWSSGADTGESFSVSLADDGSEELKTLRGRLDESPWVLISVGPGDTVQSLAAAAQQLSRSNAIELLLAARSQ